MKVESGQIWQHHSGMTYRIIVIANTTASKPGWAETVVYENEEGDVFARPISEFEMKMELIQE